jgi:hypothetical protein
MRRGPWYGDKGKGWIRLAVLGGVPRLDLPLADVGARDGILN